jgi:hypothetical protein
MQQSCGEATILAFPLKDQVAYPVLMRKTWDDQLHMIDNIDITSVLATLAAHLANPGHGLPLSPNGLNLFA